MTIIERLRQIFHILLVASLGLVPNLARAEGVDLELADRMIVEGKPAEAFALLQPYEFEQAGNTNFDYLLGLAALNSGQAGKASLILERVLTVDPLHAAARVDLGRAYFLLGDPVRARAEFTRAQAMNPPLSAQTTIREYLKAIDNREYKPLSRSGGYLELATGHNNNVNNSTSHVQIAVPALLDILFTLNNTNTRTADSYLGWAAGGETMRQVTPDWSVYAGGDVRGRNDFKYNNFDYITMDGRIGAGFKKNSEEIRAGMIAGQFDQGGMVNRYSKGINAEWRHTYNESNQPVLFCQYILYRYPDTALASYNFDQSIAGLGWLHIIADGHTSVFGTLFLGNERDTNLRIDGGKSLHGIRVSAQTVISPKLDLFASGGMLWGKYDRVNSAFLVTRDDRQSDLTLGLSYRYSPNWSVRPQLNLAHIQSNIVVDRYDQTDFSVALRRAF